MRSPLLATCSLFAACMGVTEGAPPVATNERSAIGTNLARVADFSDEWSFVDCMKQSRSWISGSKQEFDDKRPIAVDASGWITRLEPGQIARTLFFWRDGGLDYPSGTYVVLYEGEGKIEWENAQVVEDAPGRMTIDVRAAPRGFAMNIVATNPENPLRKIRVLMPGGSCENDGMLACVKDSDCKSSKCVPFERNHQKQIFHPLFLSRIQPYSVLRFMDWMATNYPVGQLPTRQAIQVDWSNRPKPTDARWTEKGVPIEVIVELSNRMKANPWLSVNHLSSDEYVRELATYVRDHLDPSLKAYVEHSNEVWNDVFLQSQYAKQRGMELGLSTNETEAKIRYHAKRSLEIFRIFQSVFRSERRFVRVMGSFAVNPWISGTALSFRDAMKETDALAIAPYFGNYLGYDDMKAHVISTPVEKLLEELEANAVPEAAKGIKASAEVAKKAGVQLIAYEGGQHLAAVGAAMHDPAFVEKLAEVNRHPKMKQVYLAALASWKDNGGKLFVHYNSCQSASKYGVFGALERLTQKRSEAPKYDALLEFIEKNPRWW
jgi:hypothetical protein